MGNTLIILLSYILNFILIILIISLLLRIRNVERKLINFSPTEVYAIVENMHEMVLESQRLADSLESSIKTKEAILEDLSDLVDEKILRYEKLATEKYSSAKIGKQILANNNTENMYKQEDIHKLEDVYKKEVVNNEDNIPKETKKDLKSKIIELNSQGKASIDIARELGISITEVQLALRLTPKI